MDTGFENPRHPIGVASERTGLSPEVIRAWERRYGAVEPARDDAGQRLYSDADVERLGLLARATAGGRAIRQVAGLEVGALAELVRGDEAAAAERAPAPGPVRGEGLGGTVSRLEARVMELDGEGVEGVLRRLLLEHGFARFAEEVAAPLLRRLGEGWHRGEVSVAQEHLASSAVRRVLESAREAPVAGAGGGDRPVAVVGTLSGERHETGILAVATAAALAGWRVVYLGADLPVAELAEAARATGARALCVSGTYVGERDGGVASLVASLRALKSAVGAGVEVYAGGVAVERVGAELAGFGVRCPASLTALQDALETQRQGSAG